MKKIFVITGFSIIFLLFFPCKTFAQGKALYLKKIDSVRTEINTFMKDSSDSPFNHKSKIHFEPVKYYKPNMSYIFHSKLIEYEKKDTIKVYGTKGDARKTIRYGYVIINYKHKDYKINVYKSVSKKNDIYYSIWFTDKTTGVTTYPVGRYLDFELNGSKDFVYTIDFNLAYNPYCAYSPEYSCAVPTKEDYIAMEIKAGEKKFHK